MGHQGDGSTCLTICPSGLCSHPLWFLWWVRRIVHDQGHWWYINFSSMGCRECFSILHFILLVQALRQRILRNTCVCGSTPTIVCGLLFSVDPTHSKTSSFHAMANHRWCAVFLSCSSSGQSETNIKGCVPVNTHGHTYTGHIHVIL